MSFGCERSCSSLQRASNFNSNVPQGGIYAHIQFERDPLNIFWVRVLKSSGSTGRGRSDAKTIISPNTSFCDRSVRWTRIRIISGHVTRPNYYMYRYQLTQLSLGGYTLQFMFLPPNYNKCFVYFNKLMSFYVNHCWLIIYRTDHDLMNKKTNPLKLIQLYILLKVSNRSEDSAMLSIKLFDISEQNLKRLWQWKICFKIFNKYLQTQNNLK